jgi:hypothetical protein
VLASLQYDFNTLEKDNFLGLKRLPIPTLEETVRAHTAIKAFIHG